MIIKINKILYYSLKEENSQDVLKHLTIIMEESDLEKAATVLQKRYEIALSKDKELHKMACFGKNFIFD